jgi:hypothetical protein
MIAVVVTADVLDHAAVKKLTEDREAVKEAIIIISVSASVELIIAPRRIYPSTERALSFLYSFIKFGMFLNKKLRALLCENFRSLRQHIMIIYSRPSTLARS